MSGEAKVLTGLLQRRALEQAFAELGRISEPAAVQRHAQTIAGYGSAALQHLLTLLDTPDPQLRGGLGQVARQLPREQVVSALRAVARAPERSDQARLAAVTLLERFLGETIDNSLIADLGNPDAAARQSIAELISAMDEEPLSVVEYLEQLGQQPPEVIDMVLDALPAGEPTPHLATLLRMLAQGEDGRLARRALDELMRLRTPAAARALASLVPNLPPALAAIAERGVRKLRFSGVKESDAHDAEREPWYAPELQWRALISTVNPSGAQFLWFIGTEISGTGAEGTAPDPHRAVFFTVLLQDPRGVRDASGSLDATVDRAPQGRREGAVHFIIGDGQAPGLTLLEAPFALACLTLREALALNWAAGETTPIGYRLFSPLIWLSKQALSEQARSKEARSKEARSEVAAEGGESGDAELTPSPDRALTDAELVAGLDHPAFYGWFDTLTDTGLSQDLAASYARRFRAMSRWLRLAGDPQGGRLAATYAHHFGASTPQASAIVASAGLAVASEQHENMQDQS